ncbi:hypothetical protein ONA92_21705 [Mycobacteroides salmoniphilum]|uniref:hypothetical protein n=1 Tax=Mycobacteroides salmoniphilum TaxID=404941 RepID=UPI003568D198
MALTLHQLREITARIAAGESRTKLGEEFGVTQSSLDESLASISSSLRAVTANEA